MLSIAATVWKMTGLKKYGGNSLNKLVLMSIAVFSFSLFAQEEAIDPPENVINPSEFSKIEGVMVNFEAGKHDGIDFSAYYNPLLKGITEAGVYTYILENEKDVPNIKETILSLGDINMNLVRFIELPFAPDSIWVRDYAPWFVYENGKRAAINNRYFGKSPDDDAVSAAVAERSGDTLYNTGLTTEGGNFMTDGKGNCWIPENVFRVNGKSSSHPEGMDRNEIWWIYTEYVGCKNIIVLNSTPALGGHHMDMFVKILNNDTILVAESSADLGATEDEVESLDNIAEYLGAVPMDEVDDQGNPKRWKIVRIPLAISDGKNQDGGELRTFHAHTNCLIVNNHVILPVFGKGTDESAFAVFRNVLPEFQIIKLHSEEIMSQGGGVHCTTTGIPVKNYSKCGDGVVNEGEECEFNNMLGKNCFTQGLNAGELRCDENCRLDESDCDVPVCGDKRVSRNEVCDGNSVNCSEIEGKEYVGGTAYCKADCSGFDESSCDSKEGNAEDDEAVDLDNDVVKNSDDKDKYSGTFVGEGSGSGCSLLIF